MNTKCLRGEMQKYRFILRNAKLAGDASWDGFGFFDFFERNLDWKKCWGPILVIKIGLNIIQIHYRWQKKSTGILVSMVFDVLCHRRWIEMMIIIISASRRTLLNIGLPHWFPECPVGSGLYPAGSCYLPLLTCIQRVPATFIKSSGHLVGGRPTLRLPVQYRNDIETNL